MSSGEEEDDPYANAIGGALKLKGGLDLKRKSSKKKKKKKKRRREEEEETEAAAAATAAAAASRGGNDGGSGRAAAEEEDDDDEEDPENYLTEAEKRYHKVMKQRASEAASTAVSKTHREKVEEFNALLDNLTEHNDIPRVSAAGNG
jgi:protein FAM32A